ncbi:MAG: aminopeptidase P family protein [Firmicutes bacterium]|nr:aminopeptidase P family protein [Bacillota bacterium]
MLQFADFKKERIETAMVEHGLTALVASLPENIYYMSGYESIGHQILSRNLIFAVYGVDKNEVSLVIPTAEVPTALERFPNTDIHAFGEFFFTFPAGGIENIENIISRREQDSLRALVKTLHNMGIKRGRVGLDEGRLTPQLWRGLAEACPHLEFVHASNIFSQIRMIKHKHEIALLECSAEIAEQSLFAVLPEIKVGTTELEIGQRYMEEVVARGAIPYFNVVTIDERSAFSDTINTAQAVKDGSIIRFDFGCVYQGYSSDLARTAVVGSYEDKVFEYYQAILFGEEQAVKEIRPGIGADVIFRTAVNRTREAGIPHYNRHHCGHGIGLEIYDWPLLAPDVKIPLEAGMVLCVETPYYELGWGGIQVEDTVEVTRYGARYLSKSSRELIQLSI